jgi:hypothetical protein
MPDRHAGAAPGTTTQYPRETATGGTTTRRATTGGPTTRDTTATATAGDTSGAALPTEVAALLDLQHGVAAVSQLLGLGRARREVYRLVKEGLLIRHHRDVVIAAEVWEDSAPWQRRALRARGVMHALQPAGTDGPYALSHQSSLAMQDLPVYGVDDRTHLVRTDGHRGRADKELQVHAPIKPHWVITVDGFQVVAPALACLQVAATFGVQAGLASTDAVLHHGRATETDLRHAQEEGSFGRGSACVRTVLEHATGLSESVGESRCRWVMHLAGLPRPRLQAPILDEAGAFVARVDFLFEAHRTIVEFDGMIKYQSPADLRLEKVREDRLRELGYQVVRVTWKDLTDPTRLRARIMAAFARATR